MTGTQEGEMRAMVCTRAGSPEVLQLQELPRPEPTAGQVRIRVEAAGMNRSEMFTRQGHSPGVLFPRVLGIEAVGTVDLCPGRELEQGMKVATLMGGMGREFDGGYAEYTVVPVRQVFPLDTELPWEVLGAIPEMYQTAAGSLDAALELAAGESILIRGGTSSVGMMATSIAKSRGCRVLATTRSLAKASALLDNGVDHVVVDDGHIAPRIEELVPGGVDKVLELVGTTTLMDSLRCVRPRGVVCMTGILGNAWALNEFEPMGAIPSTVRLTAYSGGAQDITAEALQAYVSGVEAGTWAVPLGQVFPLEQAAEAHRVMEENRGRGKLVLRMR